MVLTSVIALTGLGLVAAALLAMASKVFAVPEDPRVSKCASEGIPVLESETDSGDAYERIVRRLLGETVRYKIPFDTLLHKFKTPFGKESACKG